MNPHAFGSKLNTVLSSLCFMGLSGDSPYHRRCSFSSSAIRAIIDGMDQTFRDAALETPTNCRSKTKT